MITDLKQQKRPGRISVYVDKKYFIGLSMWQISDLKLKIGLEIEQEKLDLLKGDSEFGKLHDYALRWLTIRKRSAWEVQDYLRRKTKEEPVRARIFDQLEQKGYIDDLGFAQWWVENRRHNKLTSKRRLQQELRAKRVESHFIDQVLEEDQSDDQEILVALVVKKRRLTRYKDDKKLMQYLARQGYSYGDIKDALAKD